MESGNVPRKGRIRASAEKVEIRVSTGKVRSGQVSERWNPSRYRKGGIRASIRKVGSGRVQERWDLGKYRKGGIRASTGKVKSW